MKVLICGSRDWTDRKAILDFIYRRMGLDDILVHGGARGADSIAAEEWLKLNTTAGSLRAYPADWERHGKAAGPIRNREMLDKEQPDLVVAFLLPQSKGTRDMIAEAERRGIPVEVYESVSAPSER